MASSIKSVDQLNTNVNLNWALIRQSICFGRKCVNGKLFFEGVWSPIPCGCVITNSISQLHNIKISPISNFSLFAPSLPIDWSMTSCWQTVDFFPDELLPLKPLIFPVNISCRSKFEAYFHFEAFKLPQKKMFSNIGSTFVNESFVYIIIWNHKTYARFPKSSSFSGSQPNTRNKPVFQKSHFP